MMIHIYQNEELNDIMFDIGALQEWKDLAVSMGMTNQLSFVTRAETPIPYPNVNASMHIIFKTLCPVNEDFKVYSKTPIPLEVLKQISMSINDKHFNRIEIWYDNKKPDPIVMGIIEKMYVYDKEYHHLKDIDGNNVLFDSVGEAKNYCDLVRFPYYGTSITGKEEYLIARWADELRSIEELKGIAKERLLEKYGPELRIEIQERTDALNRLTDNITKFLNAEITEGQLKGGKW